MQKVRRACSKMASIPECPAALKDQPSLCQAHRNLRDIKKCYCFLMDHEVQGTRKQKHLGLHRQLGSSSCLHSARHSHRAAPEHVCRSVGGSMPRKPARSEGCAPGPPTHLEEG